MSGRETTPIIVIKSLRAGETIRHKPQYEPWLVIRVFEYGWFVVDLMSAEDPALPRLILPRNYDNWIRELDVPESEILNIPQEERIWNTH